MLKEFAKTIIRNDRVLIKNRSMTRSSIENTLKFMIPFAALFGASMMILDGISTLKINFKK